VFEGVNTVRVEVACFPDNNETVAGFKVAEISTTSFLVRFTVPAKPLRLFRDMVTVMVEPGLTLGAGGFAPMLKFGEPELNTA